MLIALPGTVGLRIAMMLFHARVSFGHLGMPLVHALVALVGIRLGRIGLSRVTAGRRRGRSRAVETVPSMTTIGQCNT